MKVSELGISGSFSNVRSPSSSGLDHLVLTSPYLQSWFTRINIIAALAIQSAVLYCLICIALFPTSSSHVSLVVSIMMSLLSIQAEDGIPGSVIYKGSLRLMRK